MAIEKSPSILDLNKVFREDPILEGWIKAGYQNANALYEALFDDVAPADSSQTFGGHDHAISGGPICRGVSWAADGGDGAIFTFDPGGPNQRGALDSLGIAKGSGIARYYGSPLYNEGESALVGRICYRAERHNFRLFITEISGSTIKQQSKTVSIDLPVTPSEGDAVWIDLPLIPLNPGKWNHLHLEVQNLGFDVADPPILRVFGIVITEAPGETRHSSKLILSRLDMGQAQQITTGGLGYVGFEPLDNSMANDEKWMDSDLLSRLQWFCGGLFEGALDSRAPGVLSQTVKGHDHDLYGGQSITRNTVAGLGLGDKQPFRVAIGTGEGATSAPSLADATWILADRNVGAAGLRGAAGIQHLTGPVSPGINNTGTSTTPYLDAMIFVWATSLSTADFSIRYAIYNRDRLAFSAIGVINVPIGGATSLAGWLYVDEIPALAADYNDFDIYLQCTDDNVTVHTIYCKISESALVSGDVVSQPETAGASTHLGVIKP